MNAWRLISTFLRTCLRYWGFLTELRSVPVPISIPFSTRGTAPMRIVVATDLGAGDDQTVYMFADPRFIGHSFLIEDVTLIGGRPVLDAPAAAPVASAGPNNRPQVHQGRRRAAHLEHGHQTDTDGHRDP
jgi:hypothetical protein